MRVESSRQWDCPNANGMAANSLGYSAAEPQDKATTIRFALKGAMACDSIDGRRSPVQMQGGNGDGKGPLQGRFYDGWDLGFRCAPP